MMSRKTFANFIFVALLSFIPASVRAGSWADGSVSNKFGARSYKVWVPAANAGRRALPLVMMLHGCTQSPVDFAAGTHMNEIADKNSFLVVYPEQTTAANALKCWNWYDSAHQSRGAGEPSLLAEIVNKVRADYRVDSKRVFVAGMSAGGAMAIIMGVAYPDLFAAVGVHSGLAYKAATKLEEARPAMARGGADPAQLGELAYRAMGEGKHSMRVIVFHGAKDAAVAPGNADQVISQWAQTNDYADDGRDNNSVDDVADASTGGGVPGGYPYLKRVYNDRAGKPLMEEWIVQGLTHAWSGGAGASYTDPKGPSASQEMWRFFNAVKR